MGADAGLAVEQQDEDFINKMIAEGYASAADTATHHGRLVWTEHPDGPDSGPRNRILFQQVPEAKTVKNRWHLDVRVGADNVQQQVAGLVARGATFLHEGQQGPHTWVTMADPEGNEFCIT